MSNAWDRQDRETDASWAAFTVYKNLGPCERTVRRVVENPAIKAKEYTVRTWFKKYDWKERVEGFDAQIQTEMDLAFADKKVTAIDRRMALADKMQDVAEAQLKRWLSDIEIGRSPQLTPMEVAKLIEVSIKIQRLEMGQSTENVAIEGKVTTLSDGDVIRRARDVLGVMVSDREEW